VTTPGTDPVYYVISDLHIGGDEQLGEVDFLDELLEFLEDLKAREEPTELIINGDAFGLWELTALEGIEKFDHLLEAYPELFEQLRATGEEVPITLLPGNHDHELAAYDEYVDRFAEYNVTLEPVPSITREIAGQKIHFEHGHQRDPNNRIEDWGNPHDTPLGYFYNTHVTSRAGQLSDRGRYNWLKDVQAVTPTEWMPVWLFSKYFYREMNPLLRYAMVPFLLVFNITALVAILAGLDLAGVLTLPTPQAEAFLGQFGLAGTAIWFVLVGNVAVAGLLLLVGIPLYFIRRDISKTIDRFEVFEADLTVDAEEPYKQAAREAFESDPDTALFCYGHTHRPTNQHIADGLMVNTGTWLKRLHRRDGAIGVLPPVFYPTYQLCAVRIEAVEDTIHVTHEAIEKPSPGSDELTLTERLLTLGREPPTELPEPMALEVDSREAKPVEAH